MSAVFSTQRVSGNAIFGAQQYEAGAASVQFAATVDDAVFSGGASVLASAVFNVLIDDAVFAGGVVVSGAPSQASFSVTTDDTFFSGGAAVYGSVATASFNVTTDSAIATFSASVAAIVSFATTTSDAVFFGSARSANANQYVRAPSGSGPKLFYPTMKRPSNTGGRRY